MPRDIRADPLGLHLYPAFLGVHEEKEGEALEMLEAVDGFPEEFPESSSCLRVIFVGGEIRGKRSTWMSRSVRLGNSTGSFLRNSRTRSDVQSRRRAWIPWASWWRVWNCLGM